MGKILLLSLVGVGAAACISLWVVTTLVGQAIDAIDLGMGNKW
jgi:hypothetical protein